MINHQPDTIHWLSENPHDDRLRACNYLDLCDLDLNGNAISRNIIEALLKTNSLQLEITSSKEADEKLFQLYIDHINTFARSGFHTLGLGFPIIKIKNTKTKPQYFSTIIYLAHSIIP